VAIVHTKSLFNDCFHVTRPTLPGPHTNPRASSAQCAGGYRKVPLPLWCTHRPCTGQCGLGSGLHQFLLLKWIP
jgi:hypothetical protein